MAPAPAGFRPWTRRSWPAVCAALAAALCAPALGAGILGDDYFHRMVLLRLPPLGAALDPIRDLFAFVRPGPLADSLRASGGLPWWAASDLHVALFRPLSALTHVVDYALWPDAFALQHAHSLAWLALGVGMVAVLYRAVHGAGNVAALAALLFAVADSHAMPAGWLANRNALVCLVGGTLVVLLHLRWRRGEAGLAPALLATAAALLCGEAAVGALAYVGAWQVALDPKPSWQARFAALVPYAAVVVAWRLAYVALGFGTHGSTLYVDPGRHPWQFALAAAERWPLLLAGQWLPVPIDVWILLARPRQLAASALAVAAGAGLLALLWPLLRESATARFWALGSALSLVPLCATFPMDRLLLFAGVGGLALVALLAERDGVWPFPRTSSTAVRRRLVMLLLVLHGPLAALLLTARAALLPRFGDFFTLAARFAPAGPEVAGQTFVFVTGNDFPVFYCGLVRTLDGSAPAPRRVALLASMFEGSEVRREDAHTLLVTPAGGFLARSVDRLLADPERVFAVGERVETPDFTAEVRAVTADRRPAQVAFRFRRPLEDASLCFLYWKAGHLGPDPFPLPDSGATVTLPPGSPFVR